MQVYRKTKITTAFFSRVIPTSTLIHSVTPLVRALYQPEKKTNKNPKQARTTMPIFLLLLLRQNVNFLLPARPRFFSVESLVSTSPAETHMGGSICSVWSWSALNFFVGSTTSGQTGSNLFPGQMPPPFYMNTLSFATQKKS